MSSLERPLEGRVVECLGSSCASSRVAVRCIQNNMVSAPTAAHAIFGTFFYQKERGDAEQHPIQKGRKFGTYPGSNSTGVGGLICTRHYCYVEILSMTIDTSLTTIIQIQEYLYGKL